MRLNAPKKLTWWISLVLAVIALIAELVVIPGLSVINFWVLLVGFVLIILSTSLKGL